MKTETYLPWDQFSFEAFQARRDPARVATDKKRLSAVFNLAAASPTFKQELDWAKEHGVQFFIDHTTTVGGYYTHGTGIVTIADRFVPKSDTEKSPLAASLLAHEIRHVWQDFNGMMTASHEGFLLKYIHTGLIEADATAFQMRVESECRQAFPDAPVYRRKPIPWRLSSAAGSGEDSAMETDNLPPPPEGDIEVLKAPPSLLEGFKGWYSSWKPEWYGNRIAGIKLGLESAKIYPEFVCYSSSPHIGYFNPLSRQDIQKLGEGFDGDNYLDHPKAAGFLKRVLNPSLALRFYQAASREMPEIVQKICQREREYKEAERRWRALWSIL